MTAPEKIRLDQWLVDNGHYESRNKAQAAVMEGLVLVNGKAPKSMAMPVTEKSNVEIIKPLHSYVGRGGVKLEKAIDEFEIIASQKVCLDVGASTGGFTDCLLQHGALKVYAVDVGYGQIDWKLRNDSRVAVMERTNIRTLQSSTFYSGSHPDIQLAVIDVSFISLSKVLPAVKDLLIKNGEVVALIKPQFEAGRGEVQKGGLITDPEVHERVIRHVAKDAKNMGFIPFGLTYSPISGADGNLEFFIALCKSMPKKGETAIDDLAGKVVAAAHRGVTEKDTAEEDRPPATNE